MKKGFFFLLLIPIAAAAGAQSSQLRDLVQAKNWPEVVAKIESNDFKPGEREKPILDFICGYALKQQGLDEQALARLAKAGKINSAVRDYAFYYLAQALAGLGRNLEAAENLKRISPAGYVYLPGRLQLAEIYLNSDKIKDAAREITLLKQKNLPRDLMPQLLLLEASYYFAEGNTDWGQQSLLDLYINYPASSQSKQLENPPGLSLEQTLIRGGNLMAAGDFVTARKELDELWSACPECSQETLSRLAGTVARARFYARAYSSVILLQTRAQKTAADNPEFWFYLAWSYHRLGRDRNAKRIYLKTADQFKASPYAAHSLYNLARMQQEKGKLKAAGRYYQDLIELHPESDFSEESEFQLGLICFRQKNYPAAIKVFESALAGAQEPARFKYWLAKCYERVGQKEQVDQTRQELLAQFPASVYSFLLDPCPAPAVIPENKLRLLPQTLPGNFRTGMLLARAGFYDLADAEFRWQMSIRPARGQDLLCLVQQLTEFEAYPMAFKLFRDFAAPGLKPGQESLYYTYFYPLAFSELVSAKAQKFEIEPALAYALIRQESAFAPAAKSRAGAMGLTQIMPSVAQKSARRIGIQPRPDPDYYAPDLNLELGLFHLAELLDRYESAAAHPWPILLTLSAYNAGTKPVDNWFKHAAQKSIEADLWIEQIPYSETRGYLKKVLANLRIYRARLGAESSPCP